MDASYSVRIGKARALSDGEDTSDAYQCWWRLQFRPLPWLPIRYEKSFPRGWIKEVAHLVSLFTVSLRFRLPFLYAANKEPATKCPLVLTDCGTQLPGGQQKHQQ